MKRHSTQPRTNWQNVVENQGFTFHSGGVRPNGDDVHGTNWQEGTYYEFTAGEIDTIESVTETLHEMCLAAVEHICKHPELMDKMGIARWQQPLIQSTWKNGYPYLYGRFDLAYLLSLL